MIRQPNPPLAPRTTQRPESYGEFNAMTDASERLPSLPIDTRDWQLIGDDGLVYSRFGGRMADLVRAGYEQSTGAGYAHEAARRLLEYQEALEVEALCAGRLSGNLLVKISPLPDTVISGVHQTPGYQQNVALVRLYFADAGRGRLLTRCLSLELSNQAAIRQAARQLGWHLQPGGSEAILASRQVLRADAADWANPGDRLKEAYYAALGKWRELGGLAIKNSLDRPGRDALSFVRAHPDLLKRYLGNLASARRTADGAAALARLQEEAMRRYAAALDSRRRGRTSAAGQRSVLERLDSYGGSCAVLTAKDQARQAGMLKGEIKNVTCPLCGQAGVTALVEGFALACSSCAGAVDICTGALLRRAKPGSRPPRFKPPQQPAGGAVSSAKTFGRPPGARRFVELGNAYWLVYGSGGEVLARL